MTGDREHSRDQASRSSAARLPDDLEAELEEFFLRLMLILRNENIDPLSYEAALSGALQALPSATTPKLRYLGQVTTGRLYQNRRVGDRGENLEHAREHLAEALAIAPVAGVDTAEALHNLAVVYKARLAGSRTENLEIAIKYLESALEEMSRQTEPDEWATTASQLGNTYVERLAGDRADNIERALELYDQALELRPRDKQAVKWAITMHNRGTALLGRSLGNRRRNLEQARVCFEQALQVRTETALPDHFALTQSCLADCHRLLADLDPKDEGGHLSQSIDCLHAVGRVWTLDVNRSAWMNTQLRLAAANLARADRGDHAWLADSIEASERVLLAASPTTEAFIVAMARQHVAAACEARDAPGDLARAISELELAVAEVERTGDLDRLAEYAAQLGRCCGRSDRWDQAAAAFQRALGAEDDAVSAAISIMTQRARLSLATGLAEEAAYAYARSATHRFSDVLITLERGRSRVLGDRAERESADLDALRSRGPDAELARSEFLAAREVMREAEVDEVRTGGFGTGGLSAETREANRSARDRLIRARDAVRAVPGFSHFLSAPDISLIAAAARPGRPVVYLFASRRGGFAVALNIKGDGQPEILVTQLLLSADDIDKALFPDSGSGWPGLLAAQQVGGEALDEVLDQVLKALGPTIAGPVAKLLARLDASAATLVPCGRMGALPLAAAPVDDAGLRRLLDVAAVQVAPSARLAVARGRAARPHPVRYAGVADTSPAKAGLPWAAAEVRHVARLARGSTPLVGPEGTRRKTLEAFKTADVVHIACHAIFDVIRPERSRIIMFDGDLSVADLLSSSALDGVRLVLASACETAAADVTRLPDEVTGLPTALLMAGAAGVVGTLWPVNDLAGALFMSHLAERCLQPGADPGREVAASQAWLRDLPRHEAVTSGKALYADADPANREALLDDLAWVELGAADRPFREPAYWAPYVMFGTGLNATVSR